MKLARRHAHEMGEQCCEVRLVLETYLKRDVDDLRVILTEKFLRTIDPLLQDELMRRQASAKLEHLGEMRLAHLRHPGQRSDGQRCVEILPDVLDNERQASRRNAKCLLAT